jgi:hypothetical protein
MIVRGKEAKRLLSRPSLADTIGASLIAGFVLAFWAALALVLWFAGGSLD